MPDFGIMEVQKVYQICRIAQQYAGTSLLFEKDHRQISGLQAIGLLSLCIHAGDDLLISAIGPEAQQVIQCVLRFLSGKETQSWQ